MTARSHTQCAHSEGDVFRILQVAEFHTLAELQAALAAMATVVPPDTRVELLGVRKAMLSETNWNPKPNGFFRMPAAHYFTVVLA